MSGTSNGRMSNPPARTMAPKQTALQYPELGYWSAVITLETSWSALAAEQVGASEVRRIDAEQRQRGARAHLELGVADAVTVIIPRMHGADERLVRVVDLRAVPQRRSGRPAEHSVIDARLGVEHDDVLAGVEIGHGVVAAIGAKHERVVSGI